MNDNIEYNSNNQTISNPKASKPPTSRFPFIAAEIDRSSSAPPTQLPSSASPDQMTSNPDYAAYFYSNSRLDPRLPPPIYEPGQSSWKLWSTQSPLKQTWNATASSAHKVNSGVIGARLSASQTAESAPVARNSHRHLMDMIQKDFPRTPSPASYAQQQQLTPLDQQQSSDELYRVRMSSKTPPPPGLFTPSHLVAPPRSSSTPPTANRNLGAKMNQPSPLVVSRTATTSDTNSMMGHHDDTFEGDIDEHVLVSSMRNAGLIDEDDEEAHAFYSSPQYPPASQVQQQQYPQQQFTYTQTAVSAPQYQQYISIEQRSFRPSYAQAQQKPYYQSHHNGQSPVKPMKQRQWSDNGTQPRELRASTGLPPSAFLEEFHLTQKQRRYELKDIKGHIVQFCSDQHGSRFVQQQLEHASPDERNDAFTEIVQDGGCIQLMSDVFGNYCVQKFFEFGTSQQKTLLVNQLMGHVYPLSLQMYGCRVVQKALEYSQPLEQSRVIGELKGHITSLVKDQNGNHVVQKAIEIANPSDIKMIIHSFYGQVFPLATHAYGCRVMQRIFEHCHEQLTRPLVVELSSYTQTLVQDQYGNYVIQHILERGTKEDRVNILSQVKGQILHLSRHKFASNVIEKCVIFCSQDGRQEIIDELLTAPASASGRSSDMTLPLMQMMKDQFANYVCQKLFEVVTSKQMDQILAKIKPNVAAVRKLTYGKHILTKVEKVVGKQDWMVEEF